MQIDFNKQVIILIKILTQNLFKQPLPNPKYYKMPKIKKRVDEHWSKKYIIHLLFLVIILLFLQLFFLITLYVKQTDLTATLDFYQSDTNRKIDNNNLELQSDINELSKSLLEVNNNLGLEISQIKAKASSDFSGIIETAVVSVVSIRTNIAQGTGFIITDDGYLVTNAHVLAGANSAIST